MPEPSATPPKRRLVPDTSDTIEVGGERLVRAVRVAVAERAKSIDEVAQRHLSREVAEVAEAHPEFLQALASSEQEEPIAAPDLASRIELFTDGDEAVPHPEPDIHKREGITVSPVIATEDAPPDFVASLSAPETLIDLFSMFPALDGINQYIYVERKDPKLFGGRKVAGILRPITGPMTLADWQATYGGGTYKLIVYGPPKRGGVLNADGRVPPKALTEPMTVTFPGIPSFEGEVYDDEAEMTQTMPGLHHSRRPVSSADAQVAKIEVDAALTREEREEKRKNAERERDEQRQKDREREQNTLAKQNTDLARSLADAQAEFRRESLEMQRQHQEEMRQMQKDLEEKFASKKPERSELDTALAISKNLQGDPGASSAALESLRADHARELDRLNRQSKEDHDRAEQRIKDERDRGDRIIRDAEARADARIKEFSDRSAQLERDLRERADREIQRAKDEADRRVSDLQHQHTTATAAEARNHEIALSSEVRNHQRDMDSLKAQHAMAMESLKASYEMRLETARGEVKRTASDVERYKRDAEENKDVVGKIAKIKEQAAEFGMIDASESSSEPETISQMLMKAGGGVISNLPSIIENISGMLKQRSAQDLQAARQQGRNEMIEQASHGLVAPGLPPAHRRRALESGFVPRHMSEVGPAPISPGMDPFVVQPEPEYVVPAPPPPQQHQPMPVPVQHFPQGYSVPPPPPEPAPQMQQLARVAPAPSAPPPRVAQPSTPPPPMGPAPTAPPQQGIDPGALEEDQQILQAEQLLLEPYESNISVPDLATGMFQNFGAETVAGLLSSTDAERVILAIQRSGNPDSPFLRRDGKKYLRALFEELKKRLK